MFHRSLPHLRVPPTAPELFDARFKRFLKDVEIYERKFIFQRTMDAFLDLYSAWKKTHDKPLKIRVVMLAFELHRLDPEFQCELLFPDVTCEKSS